MKKILTYDKLSSIYMDAIEGHRLPLISIIDRASFQVFLYIKDNFPLNSKILIVLGATFKGLIGLSLVRILYLFGYKVFICKTFKEIPRYDNSNKCFFDNKLIYDELINQLDILSTYNIKVRDNLPLEDDFDVVIDAISMLFMDKDFNDTEKEYILYLNNLTSKKIALDIPSGVFIDSKKISSYVFNSDETIVFSYINPYILLYPAREYVGKIIIKDIGIYDFSNDNKLNLLEYDDIKLKERKKDSYKFTYGKILFVGGQVGMAGASYLSSKAAYLMGAGLVKIYTEEANRVILQTKLPEAMVVSFDTFDENILIDELNWADTVILGPGLTYSKINQNICDVVLKHTKVPLVIDAGAISILSKNKNNLKKLHNNIIMTPHLGEMARLIGKDVSYVEDNLICTALDFTKKYNVHLVLKSSTTIISTNGKIYISNLGNDGMAVGGMGDVLSGIIGGLIPYEKDINNAVISGVIIHSLAGKIACEKVGNHQMMATDVLSSLKDAF